MTITPYDWQLEDLDTMEKAGYVALLNIEPGGGKTVLGTAAAVRSAAEVVFIIAPEGTHNSAWNPTIQAMAGVSARVIGNGNAFQKDAMSDFEFGVPGYYLITPQLFTRSNVDHWSGDMLIVDEVHQLGNPGSKGQKKLSGYPAKKGEAVYSPINLRFPMRLALSGTPARNGFERMWSIMRLLWPTLDGSGQVAQFNPWSWKADRMKSMVIRTGKDDVYGNPKTATKWLTEREPGRLLAEAPCVIQHFRRTKCCKAHPKGFLPTKEPQVLEHVVTLHKEQVKAINDLEEQGLAWLNEHPLVVELPITLQQRIRQLCLGVPTLTPIVDPTTGDVKDDVQFEWDCKSPFADEAEAIIGNLDEGEPVVIFLEAQRFAAALTERLNRNGITAFEYSGKTRSTRTQMLAEFGTTYQVAVVVISAGGTGLDGLQKVSKTEIWMETSVDNTNNTQAEARTDRMGARGQVQRFYVRDHLGYAAGRFSKQMLAVLQLRRSLVREVA